MFEDFMDHRCNIYHLVDAAEDCGYGIRSVETRIMESTASEQDVPCHFHVRDNNTIRIVQNEPFSSVCGEVKLSLPTGTDIRENDIVESIKTGLKYRAGIPKTIHNGHHIVVALYREGGVNSAI